MKFGFIKIGIHRGRVGLIVGHHELEIKIMLRGGEILSYPMENIEITDRTFSNIKTLIERLQGYQIEFEALRILSEKKQKLGIDHMLITRMIKLDLLIEIYKADIECHKDVHWLMQSDINVKHS